MTQIRQVVWSVVPDVPIVSVRTMEEVYRGSMARSSFTLVMLGIAGGMALLLGIVGIYGVVSYSVSQRTRELGIRIALGAGNAGVRAMVVRQGVLLAAIGIAVGLAVAVAVTRIMSSLLFETKRDGSDHVRRGIGRPARGGGDRELPAGAPRFVGQSGGSAADGIEKSGRPG